MKISVLLFSALALSTGAALAADQPAGSTGSRNACKADVATLCPGIQPGGHRVLSCLKQHEDKVSPACKDAMAQAQAKKAQPVPAQ